MASQKITTITTADLSPNPWNSNVVSPENQRKIVESVRRLGFFKPLLCRTLEDGTKQIIGGQHRWEAAQTLGIEAVDVIDLGRIDDKRAKEISLIDNGRYGSDDALRLVEILREIGSVDELTAYMPYAESDLAQLFASTEINLDALDLDETDEEAEGRVEELTKNTQRYQVMRFKVPADDAGFVQTVIDGICATQGFTASDSLTNAGDALVWLCGRAKE